MDLGTILHGITVMIGIAGIVIGVQAWRMSNVVIRTVKKQMEPDPLNNFEVLVDKLADKSVSAREIFMKMYAKKLTDRELVIVKNTVYQESISRLPNETTKREPDTNSHPSRQPGTTSTRKNTHDY